MMLKEQIDTSYKSAWKDIVHKVFNSLYGEFGNPIYLAVRHGSETVAAQKLYTGIPHSYDEIITLANKYQASSLI